MYLDLARGSWYAFGDLVGLQDCAVTAAQGSTWQKEKNRTNVIRHIKPVLRPNKVAKRAAYPNAKAEDRLRLRRENNGSIEAVATGRAANWLALGFGIGVGAVIGHAVVRALIDSNESRRK